MSTLMAGIKATDGKFYQKAVDWKRGKPVAFKTGDTLQTKGHAMFAIAEVTRYFILGRINGKRQQLATFDLFDEAVVAFQSGKLVQDFQQHAESVGTKSEPAVEPQVTGTWATLQAEYTDSLRLSVKKGTMRESTQRRYLRSIREFDAFLKFRGLSNLSDITPKLFESFKEHRIDAGAERGFVADVKNLNPVFAFAAEQGMIAKNPVKYENPIESAEHGAQPFSATEVQAMSDPTVLNGDALMFWILLQTGLRKGDVMDLRWSSINGFVTRKASKNRKTVRLPILPELKAALDAERAKRYAGILPADYANDFVLLNPATGKAFSGNRMYDRVKNLGTRAGVDGAHPHRFRDTFAADAFLRGCSTEEVAAYLGDDVKTVAKHYAAFITERQDRADAKMLSGESKGLLAVSA
jgi:integrase